MMDGDLQGLLGVLGGLSLSSFPSAKIKVDELYLLWLSHDGASAMMGALDEFRTSTYSSTASPSSSSGSSGLGISLTNLGSSVGGEIPQTQTKTSGGYLSNFNVTVKNNHLGQEPPRSPTKKSPKKRTHPEMQREIGGGGILSLKSDDVGVGSINNNANGVFGIKSDSDIKGHGGAKGSNNSHELAAQSSGIGGNNLFVGPAGEGLGLGSGGEEDGASTRRRRASFDTIPAFYTPDMRQRRGMGYSIRRGSNAGGNTLTLDANGDDVKSEETTGVSNGSGFPSSNNAGENEDSLHFKKAEIEEFFAGHLGAVPVEKFVHVTKRLCGLPSFFNAPLVRRINQLFPPAEADIEISAGHDKIYLHSFLQYWSAEIEPYDRVERFFRVIKSTAADFITKDDFVPFIQELLHFHPGLDFLENHEEFQRKYALTVIVRIFFTNNKSRTGRLSLREVYHSDLFRAFMHADEENEINRVRDYFSYEHFYVLYCRFFELDVNKDARLSFEDMMKYGDHALSDAIIERVFQVGHIVFSDGDLGGLKRTGVGYPDFVYFMLAEEDKTSETSIKYWFNCCDLDGDGTLSPEEMNSFYRVQLHRAMSLGQEAIHFRDVLCQLIDLIGPKDPLAITLDDLLAPDKRHISGILFDVLFNLHKFLKFEMRDPFQEKLKREDGFACEWDRFANTEYQRLAQEDTVYYEDMEVTEGGDQSVVAQQRYYQGDGSYDDGFDQANHANNELMNGISDDIVDDGNSSQQAAGGGRGSVRVKSKKGGRSSNKDGGTAKAGREKAINSRRK